MTLRILVCLVCVFAGGIAGSVGYFRHGFGGVLLGLGFGLMLAELLSLRKRLDLLEKSSRDTSTAKAEEKEEDVTFNPAPETGTSRQASGRAGERPGDFASSAGRATESASAEEKEFFVDRLFATLGKSSDSVISAVTGFFSGGNLVLRVGIVILFIGVSFLVKYAAQRNMVPLELRLAGAGGGGLVLLVIGWKLRLRNSGYGLALQGGGIGILYLVVFGAAKLYGLLPPLLSFALMVALVALSCLLAVLQDARSLAVFGSIGGFLAPVLMSTGSGSHIALFSYFALLNGGIVVIAWFKAWRELNLLGFFFTFVLGALWGSSGYRPEHFATVEPFLLLFFIFYVLISVLFALRQPVKLQGFIDGPLVFGLPLIVSALQYFLVKDFEYGMAFSTLGFGLFYLTVASLVWKRISGQLRLLCETFLALGVVFTSLTIPLALDGRWSGAIWALEGAGMVWVGVRQSRVLARHFGLLLQLAAGGIFLSSVMYPIDSRLFANQYFLGCLFLSVSALLSSCILDKYVTKLQHFERFYALPLMVLGLAWWYIGGVQEIEKQFSSRQSGNAFLFYLSATSILCGFTAEKMQWLRFRLSLLLQLPGMVMVFLYSILGIVYQTHVLYGWGLGAWGVAFFVLYRILYTFADSWPTKTGGWYHAISLWLLTFILAHEAQWAVERFINISDAWSMASLGFVPVVTVLLLLRLSRSLTWPVGTHPDTYLGAGAGGLALAMIFWLLLSFLEPGNPRPLPYIPVLNPLELTGLAILITLLLRAFKNRGRWKGWRNSLVSTCFPLVGLLFFIWINCVVARTVHFYTGVFYSFDRLFDSTIFQAAIAALWGIGALCITVWATRSQSRTAWAVGAVLLGLTVVKLFLVDLSGSGTVARIVSFLVVGILMLIIGYFSPMPPREKEPAS